MASSVEAMPEFGLETTLTTHEDLNWIRKICLALPEAYEKLAWGTPTFRVGKKQFAMWVDNHHGDGRRGVWCKAADGIQEQLIESDPEHFFLPPYVAHRGWVGIRLDRGLDRMIAAALLRDAYFEVAPKRLRKPQP